MNIYREATTRLIRANKLRDRYAKQGCSELCEKMRNYCEAIHGVRVAAKKAEDAWSEYLRHFK